MDGLSPGNALFPLILHKVRLSFVSQTYGRGVVCANVYQWVKALDFRVPVCTQNIQYSICVLLSDNAGNKIFIDADILVWVLIELAKSFQQSFFLL